MNTTLNNIRKHNPCESSWRKLLASLGKTQADDEPLAMRYILDTLGIDDAIWALRSLEGSDREIRLFACDCAERSLPIFAERHPDDKRPRNAIEVARRYANGEATEQELAAAGAAAWDAVGAAAWAAAWDAAGAARAAAGAAARAAAGAGERAEQKELFIKYFC